MAFAGRPVYVEFADGLKRSGRMPEGYFSAGIVLPNNWDPNNLLRDLNALYGGTFADEPFCLNAGARTFTFFGEGADRAHDLCDSLRDGWSHQSALDGKIVLTMGASNDSVGDFIDSVLLILPAADYLDNWKYSLFVVPDSDSFAAIQAAVRER